MYTTDRAAPERMSVEFPHCTRMEVETTTMDASMKEETRGKDWSVSGWSPCARETFPKSSVGS